MLIVLSSHTFLRSGKGYTMRQLVAKGRFPLFSFVRVDPDVIRRYLPEYSLYVHSSPEEAGRLTNKEAGYIAEILILAGLQAGKNVMVDGSLRNSEWYREYLGTLRNDFPKLKLAIIHITAPRDAIFRRAAVRWVTKATCASHFVLVFSATSARNWTGCTNASVRRGSGCCSPKCQDPRASRRLSSRYL